MSTLKVDNIRHNNATSDAITMASDGTCTAKITGMTGGGGLSHRNIIVNGDMRVAQRSVGPVAVQEGSNENYQTIDRMRFSFGNAAVGAANVSQSTDAPTTLGFTKSHKVDVTTVNTTATGQQLINLFYRIEGQDLRNSGWNHLSPSSFLTLSFYFKTTRTGTSKLPIAFRTRHGTNYYYIQNVTVTDPTNWNRYTVTIPGNSNLQIDDAITTGMDIFFTYYSGPDKDTSSEGSWGSTNAYSTSGSTNYFDSTSNDMFITGIQLEVGDTATSFEHRSYSEELARCQRYYEKIPISINEIFHFGVNQFSSSGAIRFPFKVSKRAVPGAVSIDNASFDYYKVAGSGSNGQANFTVTSFTTEAMEIKSAGAAANGVFWCHKTATGYIDASSDL
tara:strand:- start:63 stop:1232 length:1170 start_codon:yes stop_codon:yes gene_type:complete